MMICVFNWVENIVGKEENAGYQHFLSFPMFSKEGKPIPTQWHHLTPLGNMPFEHTVGKGEIARNEQFLLFPVYSICLDNFLPFSSNVRLSSANSFSLEESKICRLVMS